MRQKIAVNKKDIEAEVEAMFTQSREFIGWTIAAKDYDETLTIYPHHPEKENPYAPPVAIDYALPGVSLTEAAMPSPGVETPAERLQAFNEWAVKIGSILTFAYGRKGTAEYPEIRPCPAAATKPEAGTAKAKRLLSRRERKQKSDAGHSKAMVKNKRDSRTLVKEYRRLRRTNPDMGKSWAAGETARKGNLTHEGRNPLNLEETYGSLNQDIIKGMAGEKQTKTKKSG
jgi:hypothetical protein